jgi:hypothetical protein
LIGEFFQNGLRIVGTPVVYDQDLPRYWTILLTKVLDEFPQSIGTIKGTDGGR